MAEATNDCCPSSLPPIITSTYTTKGKFEEIADLKTYITGPTNATRGIIDVHDVFGPMSQTLQGADRLAESLNAIVLVPDFFKGNYAQAVWFASPPVEEKEKAAYDAFMESIKLPKNVESLLAVTASAKEKFPTVNGWGAFGLCWGGKVVAVASAANTPFKVSGQAHPGQPQKQDAEAITIPHICLAAPSDNKDGAIDAYKEVFSQAGRIGEVEMYSTMFHGWMGARAKLEDPENAKEFERGYNQVAAFFAKQF